MKKMVFIMMSLLLITGSAFAQEKAVIAAEEVTYDFGAIQEDNGTVIHTFKISNKGDAPLVITRVIASCGCTTPDWTKEPIAPGKKGEVKITFNPKGRPGPFVKTISVYSNGKTGSFVLTIRGDVQ
ncbi:MAG: DUF1573 domain-containing protein [Massilibacteroides sp.]|nr:DUF1573 domain-containing protein [Massilibacteroides sp.]